MSQAGRLRVLQAEGLLHPRADAVTGELFAQGGFFLAADKVRPVIPPFARPAKWSRCPS